MKSKLDERRALCATVGSAAGLTNTAGASPIPAYIREVCTAARIKQAMRADTIPIPATVDREGYHGDQHYRYWLSGLYDYHLVMKAIGDLPSGGQVVDLGGASGRVARFFATLRPDLQVTVAELNINHVDYILRYFPANARALKLSAQPQIMLPDQSCNLLYAFSVFTHIDVYEPSWLAEIHRILKPGGRAYLTIQDESAWLELPRHYVYQLLQDCPGFKEAYKPGEPMPADRLVYEYNHTNDYNCHVFHRTSYIHRYWSKWLEIVDIHTAAHISQSAVILRKV